MANYELQDLVEWDERIREKVSEFGLDVYPQEFELCDHTGMLGYMAYSGMPSHYPHWSYGKSYEKLKTLYDHGVSGLPYEMVINSNPALAYLMRDNTLLLQILTIAHVYGHNDFFKRNFTYSSTHAEYTIERSRPTRCGSGAISRTPRSGSRRSSTSWTRRMRCHCSAGATWRFASSRQAEQVERALESARPPDDPFKRIHAHQTLRRTQHPQGSLRARRGRSAFHPGQQSLPGGMGERSPDHRGRGSPSTSSP